MLPTRAGELRACRHVMRWLLERSPSQNNRLKNQSGITYIPTSDPCLTHTHTHVHSHSHTRALTRTCTRTHITRIHRLHLPLWPTPKAIHHGECAPHSPGEERSEVRERAEQASLEAESTHRRGVARGHGKRSVHGSRLCPAVLCCHGGQIARGAMPGISTHP